MGGWIFLIVVVLFGVFAINLYNTLVSLRNRFKNSYAQIDVQLNRRYDLIPNLVETAKAYIKHERETLEAVVAARNQAVTASKAAAAHPDDATAIQGVVGAETQLGGAMSRFMALFENYPDLKANQTMMAVMEELSSTENKVAFARQAYNDSVMSYNTAREQFPNNIVAGMFAFKEAQLFEVEDAEAKKAVKVSFN
jgi:LemA protein